MRTSFRLLGMPQRKKRAVTRMNGTSCPTGKRWCRDLEPLVFSELETCIQVFSSKSVKWNPRGPSPSSSSSAATAHGATELGAFPFFITQRTAEGSTHVYHNLAELAGVGIPFAQGFRHLLERNHGAHSFLNRETPGLKHADYAAKILRQGVSRTENVEFFLYKQTRLVTDELFHISNVDHTSGKTRFLHRHAKRLRRANGFNDHIRAKPIGEIAQRLVNVLAS